MESSIDLYADEYADDYADGENDLEQEIDNENAELGNGNGENEENENKDDEEKKKIKPKRVVRNPRPKLDLELLKGRKGLLCLEGYFKNKKFKGRGCEEQDLRYIMKTYEYWCHRLFPKFPFDDCLSKLEKLGTKKNVQVYLKRIRADLIFDEEQSIQNDDEAKTLNEAIVPECNDIFSQINTGTPSGLTEEQVERIRINKEKANHLRLERLYKKNAAANILQESAAAIHIEDTEHHNLEINDHRSSSPPHAEPF